MTNKVKFLMAEHLANTVKPTITEDKDTGKKNFVIEGVFMQADLKNQNGRIYPKEVLNKAVNEYVETYVSKNRAIGELNHPPSPVVDPERASHMITELRFEGSNVLGKAKLINTPLGNLVKGMLSDGVQLGVSSRGLGSTKEQDGTTYVEDDFHLATVDIVYEPSAPDAFVNGLMEGVGWIHESGNYYKQEIDAIKAKVEKDARSVSVNKKEADTEAFQMFLESL